MDFLNKMTVIMDSRRNYHHYREILKNTAVPVVPYLGTHPVCIINCSYLCASTVVWGRVYDVMCVYEVMCVLQTADYKGSFCVPGKGLYALLLCMLGLLVIHRQYRIQD